MRSPAQNALVHAVASGEVDAFQLNELARAVQGVQDMKGYLLSVASAFGHIQSMWWCMNDLQASTLTMDDRGRSILHLAVMAKRYTVVHWLMRSAAGNYGNQVCIGLNELLQLYVLKDAEGKTALEVAAARCDLQMLAALLPVESYLAGCLFSSPGTKNGRQIERAYLQALLDTTSTQVRDLMQARHRPSEIKEFLSPNRSLQQMQEAATALPWWPPPANAWSDGEIEIVCWRLREAVERYDVPLAKWLVNEWHVTFDDFAHIFEREALQRMVDRVCFRASRSSEESWDWFGLVSNELEFDSTKLNLIGWHHAVRVWDGFNVEALPSLLRDYMSKQRQSDPRDKDYISKCEERAKWLSGHGDARSRDVVCSDAKMFETLAYLQEHHLSPAPSLEPCILANVVWPFEWLTAQDLLDLEASYPAQGVRLTIPGWLGDLIAKGSLAILNESLGRVLLLIAAGYDAICVVSYLVRAGIDAARDYDGFSVLHVAAMKNALTVLKWLSVSGHARPGHLDSVTGMAPLHAAVLEGHRHCIKFLEDFAPDSRKDAHGRGWLHYAAQSRDETWRREAQIHAAERWRLDTLPNLIVEGASISQIDQEMALYKGEVERSISSAAHIGMMWISDDELHDQSDPMFDRERAAVHEWRSLLIRTIECNRLDVLRYFAASFSEISCPDLKGAPFIDHNDLLQAATRNGLRDQVALILADMQSWATIWHSLSPRLKEFGEALKHGLGGAILDRIVNDQANAINTLPAALVPDYVHVNADPFMRMRSCQMWLGDPRALEGDFLLETIVHGRNRAQLEWLLSKGTDQTAVDALFVAIDAYFSFQPLLGMVQCAYAHLIDKELKHLRRSEALSNTIIAVREERGDFRDRGLGSLGDDKDSLRAELINESPLKLAIKAYESISRIRCSHFGSRKSDEEEKYLEGQRHSWAVLEWLLSQPTEGRHISSISSVWDFRSIEDLKMRVRHECDVCGQPAKKTCAACATLNVCSKECHRASWRRHKPSCAPVGQLPPDPICHAPLHQLVHLLVSHGTDPNELVLAGEDRVRDTSLVQYCANELCLSAVSFLAKEHDVDIQDIILPNARYGPKALMKACKQVLNTLQTEQKERREQQIRRDAS